MIKINLLENHFAPPTQHEKTDSDTSAGKTIAIEAKKSRFNPYTLNYGTVVGIAGEDFVVVAGDTRLSEGYSIVTRN